MPATTVDITMYWRPRCGFCMALQHKLDGLEVPYRKVNIWEDPDGAAFVRQANDGNELVPTVVVGTATLSNPSAGQVLAAVHAQDPGTDLPPPPEPGRIAQGLKRLNTVWSWTSD
ncbi:MAG TPA: glutaredoxin domain-containing protein [Euzebya sp.]|nr:glutaredoxin domain-containing protein [Euzebya sp.]